jgi:ATP-dependent protease ClpP protease subunit
MPDWKQIGDELNQSGSTFDVIRRKYLRQLAELTKRNVIVYYSGWLQKPGLRGTEVNDADKNGFMTVIHDLDTSKGLDLLLHTPGGDTAATESIVHYLRSIFGVNMRAIVPQIAMSGGTLIACASCEVIMGKQSSLGPIDPQFGSIAAHGVIEEFKRACREIRADASKIPVWQPILAKYTPTLLGECEKAVKWSNEMAREWLLSGMFRGQRGAAAKVRGVVRELSDHAITKSHARHLSLDRCKQIGLRVTALEDSPELQDAVLSVHHACVHTLGATAAFKIIENHLGVAFIQMVQNVVVKM